MKRVALLLAALVLGTAPAAFAIDFDTTLPVYTFSDPRITESSDLLDYGAVNITTNDSSDGPFVYVVDAATGVTLGRTNYKAQVQDVEALAPAGPDEVWVGDIGDNLRRRSSVQVYRVPFARKNLTVTPRRYDLRYPDGPHDAEAMIPGPNGQLYIITKAISGGVVYATPSNLDQGGVNMMTRVAKVGDFVTDAALFPDHIYAIVRTYGAATVYTYPGFKKVGATFALPRQRQGEGISVGPGNRIRTSSEGRRSTVYQVDLPPSVGQSMALMASPGDASILPAPTPTVAESSNVAPPTPPPSSSPQSAASDEPDGNSHSWVLWAAPALIAIGAVILGLRLRRRSE